MNELSGTLLNAAVFAPFAAALFMLCPACRGAYARGLGVLASGVSMVCACVLAVWMWFYALGTAETGFYAFVCNMDFKYFETPAFGLNAVSAPMLALAGIVGFCAALYSAREDMPSPRLFMFLLMVMLGGLMGAFASVNLLCMYMFHEFALIPTFAAILLWGGAGREGAAMQMAIYLTAGALVSLTGIIALFAQTGAETFSLCDIIMAAASNPVSGEWQKTIFALLLFGLGTLVSLFPFYSWAPRTYAAAPTAFSMLHAGVLKKFGLYVLVQAALPLLPLGAACWSWTLAVLAIFNVIFIGLVTVAQRDLKMMVSYSSVAHMGLCFLGLVAASVLGVGGAVLLMFGHGLSVALLFMLTNCVVNRTGQWDMLKMGGLYARTPVLAGFFIAATFASLGLPGFANFWGELTILTSLWAYSPAVCALGATGLIISSIYGLRAVARVFFGKPTAAIAERFDSITDITLREKIPAAILIAALVFAGFCPSSITAGLDKALGSVPTYTQSK